MGGAVFGEGALYYILGRAFAINLSIRGGALFIDDEVQPFVGLRLNIGYMFVPEEENEY